jgi:hypothetical protein
MENKLFKKLNFKGQPSILAMNHPASFDQELHKMKESTRVLSEIPQDEKIPFAIAFGTKQEEVDTLTQQIAPHLADDAVFWFCYPKKSSKKYTCEFNRDTGWAVMAQYDLEPVRQVAIDEDWSALRFRQVKHIKNITRRQSYAITSEAKKRTTKKGE